VRPQLLDTVLDPNRLQSKLASLKAERTEEKSAELPPEQRLPADHFDRLSEEIEQEQHGPQRAIKASSQPAAGVPAPPPVIYLSRKPSVSQFMSVVTHCFEEELSAPAFEKLLRLHALDELWRDVEHWSEDLRSRFRQFGPCDVRFLEPKLAEVLAGFVGRHAFSTEPPEARLGDQAKVFVVGDWATALPQARNVAARIRERLLKVPSDIDCHVIHLGDTYYSGLEDECRRRFLDQWPVQPGWSARSWTLAGNHDMYSGGHGFFDVLLADARFAAQNRCSYFALTNDHWQILGLDSSYKDPDKPDLQEPQVQWLSKRVHDAGARRTLLLTHHQPFSAYETVDTQLVKTMSEALAGNQAEAWLWGHEHRCTVYQPDIATDSYRNLARYTALIGHGGVPSLRSAESGPEGEADVTRDAVRWEFDDYYRVGDDHWGLGGFAVLTFAGAELEIQYYDEYGKERRNGAPLGHESEAASGPYDPRPACPPDVLPLPPAGATGSYAVPAAPGPGS
jgi:Calcineurin-like phosphoesterase